MNVELKTLLNGYVDNGVENARAIYRAANYINNAADADVATSSFQLPAYAALKEAEQRLVRSGLFSVRVAQRALFAVSATRTVLLPC